MREEGEHPVADQVGGRQVPGQEEELDHGHDLLVVQFVAVLLGLVSGDEPPTLESLSSSRLQAGLVFGALVALPVTLALWFAPALDDFKDVGPGVALGASLRAALANWRPMVVYAAGVLTFGVLLPLLAGQMLLMLMPRETMLAVVRFLLAYVGQNSFAPFAWYRIAFGGLLLAYFHYYHPWMAG